MTSHERPHLHPHPHPSVLQQHRLLGFGSNYFHALGGSTEVSLDSELSRDEQGTVLAREYLHGYDVEQVCCTTSSSLILTKSGKVYQVGMLHGMLFAKPERVPLTQKVLQLAGGRHFCLARCHNGSVLSWGAGHFGQLGHGPNISLLLKPQVMAHLLPSATAGSPVVSIACGAWHGTALLQDGRLYTWGSNRRNQCGVKSPATIVHPQAIEGRYADISCGKGHNVALERGTGRVYTWGSSLGCGHTSRRTTIQTPKLLEALQRVVIVRVAAGDSHSLALTGGGRVFSWGVGPEGQLGMGGALSFVPRPKLVGDLDFVAIVAGQQLSDSFSQLSQPSQQNATTAASGPRQAAPDNLGTSMSSVSTNHTVLVDPPTTAPTIGRTILEEAPPTAPHILANVPKVISIHAAGCYSLAISSSGHVYAWGYNDIGNLGLPHSDNLPVVEPVTSTIAQVKCRTPEAKAFDSRHNVLLPTRVDALRHLNVSLVAGGPTHLLVYGQVRDPNEIPIIGRTLHEVQKSRRLSNLASPTIRTDDDDFSIHSAETDAVTMATDTTSVVTDLNALTPDSKAPSEGTRSASSMSSPQSNSLRSPTTATTTTTTTNTRSGWVTLDSSGTAAPGTPTVPKKPRAMGMSKIMQKLTSGSERKKNGDATASNTTTTTTTTNSSSRPKFGRVLGAAFGTSGK